MEFLLCSYEQNGQKTRVNRAYRLLSKCNFNTWYPGEFNPFFSPDSTRWIVLCGEVCFVFTTELMVTKAVVNDMTTYTVHVY